MNALITGASSGIGLEFAKLFAKDKINVILVARDQKGLDTVAADLRKDFGVNAETMAIDLSLPGAAEQVHKKVAALGRTVDYLINNAGFGDYGNFLETDAKKEQSMIELNISALTELCKLFIPGMAVRKSGKILNVASTAAFLPGPFMAVYYATKAYVLSFSQAINGELRNTGVTVTALCPGPTKTNFEKAANAGSSNLFKGNLPSAQTVAMYGYKSMMKGKSVAVQGFRNKTLVFMMRFLPRNFLTAVSRRAAKS